MARTDGFSSGYESFGFGEIKAADFHFQRIAIVRFEMVRAFHRAPFGAQVAVAGVFESFSGCE